MHQEKFCSILWTFVKFLDKVCPTLVHFQWHEWKWSKLSQYQTILDSFGSDFNNFYLKYFGLLHNLMRNCEILQKFMKSHETNKIFLIKSFTFVHLQCTLLTFAFTFPISDFEIWPKILVLVKQFWNFEFVNLPIIKV